MLDKEKVGEMFSQGFSYETIAAELNAKKETVRKCIQRNFRQFRNSHQREKIRRKETDRITRFEAKQYMSDKDFIKRNKSIYINSENGDIVLDRKVAPIVSFDVPRRYNNEFSKERVDNHIKKSGYRKDNLLFT